MLSPMAKGIQSLHSTVELFNKYVPNGSNDDMSDSDTYDFLFDWSLNHKTCISLNGGVSPDLNELKEFFDNKENIYPWADFNEDESLGMLMTSISIVLPEKIYLMKDYLNQYKSLKISDDGEVLYLEIPEFKQLPQEDLEKIDSFGNYSLYEIDLIYRIMNYKLAS
jgi:hypothetical protein